MTQHTQATIYRVLQLLTRLKTGQHRRNTLARQLGVHEKTITRYIALLTNIGYTINEDSNNRYSLAEPDTTLVTHHFEPLEIEVLGQLLVTLPDSQPLKQALWHKVVLQSNLLPLADALTNVAISKIAAQLAEAVLKKQVILRGYTSSDGTVKDLLVEPLELTNSFQIMVYDVERQKVITPALDRIGSVEILDMPQTYKGDTDQQDIFGYSDMPVEFVHLELTFLAYTLMLREYPLVKPYLSQDTVTPERDEAKSIKGVYHFKGPILSYIGIGRFCLSLLGHVKVVDNEGLRRYLNEKLGNNRF